MEHLLLWEVVSKACSPMGNMRTCVLGGGGVRACTHLTAPWRALGAAPPLSSGVPIAWEPRMQPSFSKTHNEETKYFTPLNELIPLQIRLRLSSQFLIFGTFTLVQISIWFQE